MTEDQAREKMTADILASIQRKPRPVNLITLMMVHKALGHPVIQIEGEVPHAQVGSQFRQDWADGVILAEMARDAIVSVATICRLAKAAKLKSRLGGRKQIIQDTPAFRASWRAGIPVKAIADTLGVSATAVYRAASIANLPPRPFHPSFIKRKAA